MLIPCNKAIRDAFVELGIAGLHCSPQGIRIDGNFGDGDTQQDLVAQVRVAQACNQGS